MDVRIVGEESEIFLNMLQRLTNKKQETPNQDGETDSSERKDF